MVVQDVYDDFIAGEVVRGYICNVFGAPGIILRSPMKEARLHTPDTRVVEILLLPLTDGFVAAAAYRRNVGEGTNALFEILCARIDCWRFNLSASKLGRGEWTSDEITT